MQIIANTRGKLALLRSDRRGAVAVVMGLTLTGMVGFTALAVDVGTALVVRKGIQASTDSAALAGAAVLGTTGATGAISVASTQGNLNSTTSNNTTIPVQMPAAPTARCLTSIGVQCTGTPAANAIVVRQLAVVPTYFTKLFGFSSITVSATSTAAIAGGVTRPVNVQVVLDSTGSMNATDSNCSKSKMSCALNGAEDLLTGMAPSASQVGLMTFPPTTTASRARAYDCNSGTNQAVVAYNNTGASYNILAPSNNFRSSDTSPVGGNGNNLNTGSNLVKAVGGGATSCPGMAAIGGVGTYFAEAIRQAQAQLAALPVDTANPAQNVIILLSDGDATAEPANISAAQLANQCKQAVDAANDAKAAGTVIYSVAYDAPTSGGCGRDTARITPCQTMAAIASGSANFFTSSSGGAGGCTNGANTTGLSAIFQNIGQTFRGTRLVPNNTI